MILFQASIATVRKARKQDVEIFASSPLRQFGDVHTISV